MERLYIKSNNLSNYGDLEHVPGTTGNLITLGATSRIRLCQLNISEAYAV